jgi:lysophospholipase L1-like esterase
MHNILIFGDSIAAGRNVQKTKSWPSLFSDYIDRKDKASTLVHNLSIVGNSTAELLLRLLPEIQARYKKDYPNDYFVLIFAIGINDSKNIVSCKKNRTSDNDFITNIKKIIDIASSFSNQICFIGFNPVNEQKLRKYSAPFTNESIIKYDKIIKNICKENKILFIDTYSYWTAEKYKKLLSKDGLHPNELGHQKIFKALMRNYPKLLN